MIPALSPAFERTDRSVLGRWWWTVDRLSLAVVVILIGAGAILIQAAAPAAGARIGLEGFHLASRQILLIPLALALLICCSLLPPRWTQRAAFIGLTATFVLLVVTLMLGPEIKGARRWLPLMGVSVQPAELLKPCFVVAVAWLLASEKCGTGMPGRAISLALWAIASALLLLQPDVGQTFVLSAVFGFQLFLAGLPMLLVVGLALAGVLGLAGAYVVLPHARQRIDTFLDPEAGDRYQVERSLEAFGRGGLIGTGPGEGEIKASLPDAHSDFILAVAGEEFGLVLCLLLVAAFAFLVLRGFARVMGDESLFVLLAAAGLLATFGLQALINMSSTLDLIPTKGMTLPFISYGGSSLLALAASMGMVLALTRRRPGGERLP